MSITTQGFGSGAISTSGWGVPAEPYTGPRDHVRAALSLAQDVENSMQWQRSDSDSMDITSAFSTPMAMQRLVAKGMDLGANRIAANLNLARTIGRNAAINREFSQGFGIQRIVSRLLEITTSMLAPFSLQRVIRNNLKLEI